MDPKEEMMRRFGPRLRLSQKGKFGLRKARKKQKVLPSQ